MEIFRNLKTFLYNHRRKFLISGIAVGGAVAVFNYLRQQEEKRQKYEISEFLENVRRQRHFETIQTTCDQTILSLSKQLEKNTIKLVNIDRIVADLKTNPPKSIDLWEDLKVSTFTEICLLVYSQTLIGFVLKIQFAIMGGYMYKNLNENNEQVNRTLQERYLSLCVNFAKTGLLELRDYIRHKVSNVVSGLDLKKKLTIQGLQDIFWSIQASIDTCEFIDHMPSFLHIESQIENQGGEPMLNKIYEETADIVSAKELTSLCVNSLLHCEFRFIMDRLVNTIVIDSKNVKGLPAAKFLPILHNTVKSLVNDNDVNLWSMNLIRSEKLKVLAANVYESYC